MADIIITAPDIRKVTFTIVGTSPLISHKWSEKAKRQILDKQMKKATQAKEAKNPEQDFEDSIYRFKDGGCGFPAIGIKAAMVRAGKSLGFAMTDLRAAFHINGERGVGGEDLIRIHGEPTPREDMVRVGMGTADIRYRAEFVDWSANITVKFNARNISEEQLAGLLMQAGFGTGLGEWRVEKDGSFGTWELAS